MMPPPELQPLETSVTQLFSGITNITRDVEKLIITAGDRYEKFSVASGPTPATIDQVRWMNKYIQISHNLKKLTHSLNYMVIVLCNKYNLIMALNKINDIL